MIGRLAPGIVAALIAVAVPVSPAAAHRTSTFDACIGRIDVVCRDSAPFLVGDHPRIAAEVRPTHSRLRAEVLRRPPRGDWERVTSVAIHGGGRMSWTWDTEPSDARRRPWRFTFRIPGHGQSDVVRIRVTRAPY